MKKYIILTVLFVMPICAYLFFATGVNQFVRLPVITEEVNELPSGATLSGQPAVLKDRITILGFSGLEAFEERSNAFNLDVKIYKKYFEFTDFQVIFVAPLGTESQVTELRKELEPISDLSRWDYLFLSPSEIEAFYASLQVKGQLDKELGSDFVFMIDKDRKLRGRTGANYKGVEEYRESYDTTSPADLNNVMMDDLKVLIAEYRLALKKYQRIK